ncbi:LppX_LprAFG lipoprotein [Aeromicrobium piscarium]|uniref:LppX_LprAFG lipoprotein n=1 Tax=Aeromicrobium piscarium TaxID=2590901 RepID=UPI00163DCBC7|nr:LppX_LprAFG lipoprotein [Aeromicrobium piscarium]
MRTPLQVIAALVAALVLTACTSDEGSSGDPEERLDAAAARLQDAPAIDFSIGTDELPRGVTGLLSVKGHGDTSPAFEGEARVVAGGTTLPADVIATDGKLWVKTGLSSEFLSIDPAQFGIPDPAQLVSGEDGVLSLLTSATDLEEGEDVRDGRDVLTTITGSLAGADVARLLPTADESGTFEVEFRLNQDDELTDAVVTGPFYAGEDDVAYTLTITALDEPVEITEPARDAGR